MRFKVAPPVRSLAELDDARRAIPLVPDAKLDCCRAVQRAIDCPTREDAREYVTFLQALGLLAETDRGYHRTATDVDDQTVVDEFRQNVFGVEELLTALETEPLTPDDAFDALCERIPRWERNRHADWESTWRERVRNLLEWAVVFDLVSRTAQGYELKQ